MLKPGALALFMAADRVAAAKDGRVALASKITADRIVPDIGFGIVIDLDIAPYLAESCEAPRIVVAGEIAANLGCFVATFRSRAVLNIDITANDDGPE